VAGNASPPFLYFFEGVSSRRFWGGGAIFVATVLFFVFRVVWWACGPGDFSLFFYETRPSKGFRTFGIFSVDFGLVAPLPLCRLGVRRGGSLCLGRAQTSFLTGALFQHHRGFSHPKKVFVSSGLSSPRGGGGWSLFRLLLEKSGWYPRIIRAYCFF